jgi:Holliday junction resolvasome RuvABC ATP-dependent DNA helicase subunit
MNFELKQSERKAAKIRLPLHGPPGSGKSMSALLIAFGLTGDWKKIAAVDTERGSANIYSHLGSYYVLTLEEPLTPSTYIEAIRLCENSGIECIILDSISHEWSSWWMSGSP